jgi:hypothetical protein
LREFSEENQQKRRKTLSGTVFGRTACWAPQRQSPKTPKKWKKKRKF